MPIVRIELDTFVLLAGTKLKLSADVSLHNSLEQDIPNG
jgi:hypothetical protein